MTHISLKNSATRPHESLTCQIKIKLGPFFTFNPLVWLSWIRIFQWNMCQKKYEFDRKFNLKVHRLLKTEISFIDKMVFSYYVRILLWQCVRGGDGVRPLAPLPNPDSIKTGKNMQYLHPRCWTKTFSVTGRALEEDKIAWNVCFLRVSRQNIGQSVQWWIMNLESVFVQPIERQCTMMCFF